MNKRSGPRKPTPRAAATAGSRRKRRGTPRAALVTIAVVVLALAAWALARFGPWSHGRAAPAPIDPVATLGTDQALSRGIELGRAGRHRESLRYFRRAAEAGSGWLGHWDYAAALNNSAIQVSVRYGFAAPASRSAIERMQLVREALDQVSMAEQLAPDAHTRAMMEIVRGRTLELWGFPLEALDAYRTALVAEPGARQALEAEKTVLVALRGGSRHAAAP